MTTSAHFSVRRSDSFEVTIELELDPGTTTALLGPNGAGKSTIVEALTGLLPIDSGQISIAGRVVDDPADGTFVHPEHRRVGVVFQEYLLFDHLNVLDNIAFAPRSSGMSRAAARSVARDLATTFELSEVAEQMPMALSGGQAQRVALARTLASNPELLLLDEPLAALDVDVRTRLRRQLARHVESYSGPRLLITHDPTDAFLLADRIVVIEQGRVTQSGTPDEIRRHPETPYVAALSGRNLLYASCTEGVLEVDGSDRSLQTSDMSVQGRALVSIAPSAIALHPTEPHGSPRNTWLTFVSAIEPLGDTSRVYLGDPLRLAADVTPGAVNSLDLRPGTPVWASIKATEIDVTET
jgi:molybdate transport system ATP-binding protein